MNSFVRALLFIYSVVIAVLSVVLLYATVDEGIFSDILKNLNALTTGPVSKYIYIGVLLLLFIISIVSITNIITTGRLNRKRLRKNDIGTVDIKVNTGTAITNDLIRGTVRGLKVDEDGKTVSGATFGLFLPNETEFDVEHAIMTSTTNEEGIFIFEKLVYGDYVIREIKAAEGFVLNETVYPVSIKDSKIRHRISL